MQIKYLVMNFFNPFFNYVKVEFKLKNTKEIKIIKQFFLIYSVG